VFAAALKRAQMELPLRYAFTSHNAAETEAEPRPAHTVH
jgi:hypothetical protein